MFGLSAILCAERKTPCERRKSPMRTPNALPCRKKSKVRPTRGTSIVSTACCFAARGTAAAGWPRRWGAARRPCPNGFATLNAAASTPSGTRRGRDVRRRWAKMSCGVWAETSGGRRETLATGRTFGTERCSATTSERRTAYAWGCASASACSGSWASGSASRGPS